MWPFESGFFPPVSPFHFDHQSVNVFCCVVIICLPPCLPLDSKLSQGQKLCLVYFNVSFNAGFRTWHNVDTQYMFAFPSPVNLVVQYLGVPLIRHMHNKMKSSLLGLD